MKKEDRRAPFQIFTVMMVLMWFIFITQKWNKND